MQYTTYGYRLQTVSTGPGYHWILLPGGPGLGSEYLLSLCQQLQLPGTVLLADFPKDGTNREGTLQLQHWQDGLVDLVKHYPQAILVTHSFAGMMALSVPAIEDLLAGLVLMNTTTANTFFQHVSAMRDKYGLPDLAPAASLYHFNPSSETYRAFWDTYKYYYFTQDEIAAGEKMMSLFAFNNEAYYYAIQHFYGDYVAKWVPRRIPFMTIASENDYICPPRIFAGDARFATQNATHYIIPTAGHCPWLAHGDEVKGCFDAFITGLS
jgi:pimeloyl-ACP methyl ester carboxylesterase